jgi:hypothetical protein
MSARGGKEVSGRVDSRIVHVFDEMLSGTRQNFAHNNEQYKKNKVLSGFRTKNPAPEKLCAREPV